MAHMPGTTAGDIPLGSSRQMDSGAPKPRSPNGRMSGVGNVPLSARVSSSTGRPNQAQNLPGSVVITSGRSGNRFQSAQRDNERVNPHAQMTVGAAVVNRIYKSPTKNMGGEKSLDRENKMGQQMRNINENSQVRTKVHMQSSNWKKSPSTSLGLMNSVNKT